MLPLVEDWARCPGCGAGGDGASVSARALHVIANSKRLVASPFLGVIGCELCGLVYTTPRPDPAALALYYDGNVEGGWTRQHPVDDSEKMRRKHAAAERALGPILHALPVGGSALDYGCGAGAMLDVLQRRGWSTAGLEPGRIAAYAAQRHELIAAIPAVPSYHLVIVHHVLEHVLDAGALLRQLHAAAFPGAHIVVGVPSLEGIAVTGGMKYACSALHINAFTRDSLANVLRVSGWQPVGGNRAADRRRILMHGARADAGLVPRPGALAVAANALQQYGRRLDARGEFSVCPFESADAAT
jgi:hypothetical protein